MSEIKEEIVEMCDECKRCGECFRCRHHDTIRTSCRVDGKLCEYPKTGCVWKDYPYGR